MLEKETVWEIVKKSARPLVLYGMGDGADRIMELCAQNGLKIQGIFASDAFVRGQSFRSFKVESYDALKKRLGEPLTVLVAFASELPEVLARFKELAQKEEVLAPHLPLFGEKEQVSREWLRRYEKELKESYAALADAKSREVFAAALNYRLSGRLSYLFDCATSRKDDILELVKPSADEIYMDLGAYNGDTLAEFASLTGRRWQLAVAVEPDRRNARKLRQFAAQLAADGLPVEVHEQGIWNCQGELGFSDSGGRQSTFCAQAKKQVPVTTVDALAADRAVSYIKMDLEGAEMQALEGARHTLAAFRPRLFLAAYHYDTDLFRLPLFIRQLKLGYKIYLRKHPYVPCWELNYICVH